MIAIAPEPLPTAIVSTSEGVVVTDTFALDGLTVVVKEGLTVVVTDTFVLEGITKEVPRNSVSSAAPIITTIIIPIIITGISNAPNARSWLSRCVFESRNIRRMKTHIARIMLAIEFTGDGSASVQ